MIAAPADLTVLRITPMQVLPDIAPSLRRYEALGFERVESGDAGCVGLRAGETALILASVQFMSGDYDALVMDRLTGQTIPYIHVESVARASARLRPVATVVQDVWTHYGTRELLVDDDGDLFILAEKVA
jgi:ethanolamine utilization microcompartment shell protein EutS